MCVCVCVCVCEVQAAAGMLDTVLVEGRRRERGKVASA